MKNKFLFFLIVSLLPYYSLLACYSLDPQRTKSRYYKEGRFHNITNDSQVAQKGLWDVIVWKFFTRKGPPLSAAYTTNDLPKVTQLSRHDLLAKRAKIRIIWLGHSTVWIAAEHKGQRLHIITDPIFEGIHQAHERLIPLPIPKEELLSLPIDAVLVSHAHRDHLDFASLRKIEERNPQIRIFLPEGTAVFAREEGLKNINIIEWWEQDKVKNAKIQFTPAHHWSRLGLYDFMQTHWGSYVIEIAGQLVYFGGDTGYSIHFQKIAKRYPQGFAAALLPIGAFRPRWFMKEVHIDPKEAIQATQDLRANLLLPIHWGTFRLGDDFPLEAIGYLEELLQKNKSQKKALLWRPGQAYTISL